MSEQDVMQAKNRDALAVLYAAEIRRWQQHNLPIEIFAQVNNWIIDRWSISGLEYIKRSAWKLVAHVE